MLSHQRKKAVETGALTISNKVKGQTDSAFDIGFGFKGRNMN
jgi:hypothetical protein